MYKNTSEKIIPIKKFSIDQKKKKKIIIIIIIKDYRHRKHCHLSFYQKVK